MKRRLTLSVTITLFIATILAAATWATLPFIVSSVAKWYAEHNGLEEFVLEAETIGWDRAHIQRLAFRSQTPNGPVALNLRGGVLRYRLLPFSFTSLSATSGDMAWRQTAGATQADTPAALRLELPAQRITVEDLWVTLDTDWGRSQFRGRMEAVRVAEDIQLRLGNKRQVLEASLPIDLTSLALRITTADDRPIVSATFNQLSLPVTVDASVQLDHLNEWSDGNLILPRPLRDMLQPVPVDAGALSVSVQIHQREQGLRVAAVGKAKWSGLRQPGFTLDGDVQFSVDNEKDDWQIRVLPKSRLSVADVRWGDDRAYFTVPGASFAVDARARATSVGGGWAMVVDAFTARSPAFTLYLNPTSPVTFRDLRLTGKTRPAGPYTRVQLNVSAKQPVLASLGVTADDLSASAEFDTDQQISAQGRFVLTGARVTDWPQAMSGLKLDGRFENRDGKVTARGQASLGPQPVVNWRMSPIDKQAMQLTADVQADADKLWTFFKPLFGSAWRTLSLQGGRASGNASLVWSDTVTSSLALKVIEASGKYQGADFHGLRLEADSSDLLAQTFDVRVTVNQGSAASGIQMAELNANLLWQDDIIEVRDAGFTALEGGFRFAPSRIDLKQPRNTLSMRVMDLDLAKLLEQIDQPGLTGSGRLSGVIPLTFIDGAIEVPSAELASTGGGTLRYQTSTEAGVPIDNIALKALQNFQYDVLRAWIDYQQNGDYRIRIRLEGRNPQLYDGFPIAFNLNLTGTLPGLLQAGLFSGDFSQQILKNIESERRK